MRNRIEKQESRKQRSLIVNIKKNFKDMNETYSLASKR